MHIENSAFANAAEGLFRTWLTRPLALRAEFGQVFDTEFLPEPYLCFGEMHRPLVWMTMNPGKGFDFQRHPNSNGSLVLPKDTYAAIARRFGMIYASRPDLITRAATSRIDGMMRFAKNFGFSGVIQVERYPFHSASTNETPALGRVMRKSSLLAAWEQARNELLRDAEAAVALACASPADSPSAGVIESLDLLGLGIAGTEVLALRRTETRVSQALWFRKDIKARGVLVSQGALVVPKDEVLGRSTKYHQIGATLGWLKT